MSLEGKVAVVLGGARALGRDYVRLLLKHGAKVAFGDVRQDAGKSTESELQTEYGSDHVFYQFCDVTSLDQLKGLFTKASNSFGYVDIVANTAGICKEFDWQKTVDINLGGTIRLTTVALSFMSKQHGGRGGVIVHTSSLLAFHRAVHSPVYGATKAAIVQYCRSFAAPEHFAATGVRFNVICPPFMPTPMNGETYVDDNVYFPEEHLTLLDELEKKKQYVTTETCAEALTDLIENDSMNGQVAVVTVFKGILYDTASDYTGTV